MPLVDAHAWSTSRADENGLGGSVRKTGTVTGTRSSQTTCNVPCVTPIALLVLPHDGDTTAALAFSPSMRLYGIGSKGQRLESSQGDFVVIQYGPQPWHLVPIPTTFEVRQNGSPYIHILLQNAEALGADC
jgi:hypothetical protein